MFCSKCGSQINSNSQFCSVCGTPITQTNNNLNIQQSTLSNQANTGVTSSNNIPNNNINNNKKSNTKLIIIVIAIVLGVLLVIFGGIYLVTQMRLREADKLLQEEAEHINDSLNSDLDINVEEEKENANVTYNVGDSVQLLDGSNWYVVSQSESNVVLLSSQNYGEKVYFSENGNYYDMSNVKSIIENNFIPELKTSLLNKSGDVSNLEGRILTVSEIRSILNISSDVKNTDIEIKSENRWLFETGNYWLTDRSEDSSFDSVYIIESWGSFAYVNEDIAGLGLTSGNMNYIRPVIETTVQNIK